jgi:hypothetical protein
LGQRGLAVSEAGKFVATRGVLGFGIPMFLITAGWDLFLNPRSNLRATSHFTSLLLFDLLVWFLLGGLFGVMVWRARSNKAMKNRV